MKKMAVAFLAVAVLVGCTAAFGQNVSPTVYQKHGYFYNTAFYEVLQKLSASGEGSSKVYVAGWDYYYGYYGSNVGQKHGIGSTVPPHFGQTGSVLDVGSETIAAYYGYPTGAEQDEYLLDLTHGIYEAYYSLGVYGYPGDYTWIYDYLQPGLAPSKGEPAKRAPGRAQVASPENLTRTVTR